MDARWKLGLRNGLEVVEVEAAASTAAIALQGAQVLSFAPRGQADWLWVSERARWAPGAALRGGIPICFPWFGPHASEPTFPAHGFARTSGWRFAGAREESGRVSVDLALASDERTSKLFPHAFEARLTVTVGEDLALAFETTNTGPSAFSFEVALHTYLAVADVADIQIEGLAGRPYADKVSGEQRQEGAAPIRIAGEVDRVYDNEGLVVLVDAARGRRLRIESTGAGSTVVWNPAPAKTATLSDMAPDGFRRFVCIETGAIGQRRVTLAPGARHQVTARYAADRG